MTLGKYTGPVILREIEVPVHNPLYKRYPQRRNRFGKLVSDHKVTLEQELAEIRARHELRREYNRQIRAAKARRRGLADVTVDYSALDQSDA